MKDSWTRVVLSDYVDLKHGYQFRDTDFTENGIPIIKIGNVWERGLDLENVSFISNKRYEIFKSYQIKNGDILMSLTGNIGRVVEVKNLTEVVLQNYRVGNFYSKDESVLEKHFIKWILGSRALLKQLEQYSNQSAQANFGKQDLDKLKFNLPPLPQQQKIAKILSTVDKVIEKTESAIAKYQAIKQGLMHDLFELQSDNYWSFCELGDIANIIDPHPSHRAPIIDDRGIPFIGIGDIDESGNLIKNARKVSEKIFDEHSLRYKLSDKTIGFGRVATIGKIIRFKNYDFKFTVSPTMAIIHPNKIESDYLAFALDSNYMKTQIDKLLTGSTRSSLGIELLRKLIVKVPVDADEKIKISKALNSIVQKIDLEKQALAKYQQLKGGLLQDLLTGKVEVKVD